MAVTVATEANVALTPGAATEIINALVGRKGFCFQLQGPGFAWIKLGGTAAKNDGIRIGSWETVALSLDWDVGGPVGSAGSWYEGAISAFYEGGPDPDPVSSANMRVLEMT